MLTGGKGKCLPSNNDYFYLNRPVKKEGTVTAAAATMADPEKVRTGITQPGVR